MRDRKLTDAIQEPLPVEILLPAHWLGRVRYRLQQDEVVGGYRMPAGFETDGASVPRLLWWLFPPIGRYLLAALVHDHALEDGHGWSWSNDLFDQTLCAFGIRGWRRVVMVAAVRANGAWQRLRAWLGLGGRYVG
jgi:hypothetical protein